MPDGQLGALTLALLLILGGAHGLGYLFARWRQPRVIGEILAGILLGPSVFGRIAPSASALLFGEDKTSPARVVLGFLYSLGLLLLLFASGSEVRNVLGSRETRRQTWWLLGIGTSLPFAIILAFGAWLPLDPLMGAAHQRTSLLLVLAIAVAVTSIPVISKIFADLGILESRFAGLILGMAMLEDILLWGVLGVATSLAAVRTAGVDPMVNVTRHLVISTLYIGLGLTLAPKWLTKLGRSRRNVLALGSPVGWIVVVIFAYTAAAAAAGVNVVFGAFLAGFGVLGGFKGTERARFAEPVGALGKVSFGAFVPVYFAIVGYRLDLTRTFSLGMLVAFLVGSSAIRLLSMGLAARLARLRGLDIANVAITANARGGPGIVLASVAFDAGIISPAFFTTLVLTAILTSQATGFWLELVLRKGLPLLSSAPSAGEVPAPAE
ncbi:cation:proton antiporter [Pendulispora albinea]|uniref:Cation:proton antiporter n=1 Tax=Pendulispora albinea TaxID=2741071 RepID=A0ABZ2LLI1_9BACT